MACSSIYTDETIQKLNIRFEPVHTTSLLDRIFLLETLSHLPKFLDVIFSLKNIGSNDQVF